jgi:hypothetical protein
MSNDERKNIDNSSFSRFGYPSSGFLYTKEISATHFLNSTADLDIGLFIVHHFFLP